MVVRKLLTRKSLGIITLRLFLEYYKTKTNVEIRLYRKEDGNGFADNYMNRVKELSIVWTNRCGCCE